MITVPQGFVLIEQGPLTLVVHQDYRERLLQCGLGDPERLCAQQTGVMHSGRGIMPTIEFESPAERIVVRKYRRGGLLRFLNADVFLGPQRPFDELAVTLQAAKADIPVAEILGALSQRVCGPLYRTLRDEERDRSEFNLLFFRYERTGAEKRISFLGGFLPWTIHEGEK